MANSKSKPSIINPALLWEYDLDTFNWEKSYKIVIERVVQLGDLNDWQKMLSFYKREQILETVDWSKQLDKRDKQFAKLFINSNFLNAA
jgi:hypothetical protein